MSTASSNPLKIKYDEVMKCGEDPSYFITKYLYVQHPVKGRIPFQLFPFQKDCINDFLTYRHNIIVKSRQLGLSETVSGYCLWLALFHRDKNIVIMATTLKTAGLMVRKIREKFKMLPEWMTKILNVTEPEANSKNQLRLSNGSNISAVPTTDGAVRGEAGSIVVVDEAAHIDNLHEVWKAIWPTLSTGGSTIVFSSPNGKNYFHEMFAGAETKKNGEKIDAIPGRPGIHLDGVGANGFHAIKLPWTVHPERDETWFEEQSAGMDAKGIAQEFNCNFESSGTTYFGFEDIDWIRNNITNPVGFSGPRGKGNDLWIWKTAVPDRKYIICADVARGDAEDFSAFHVIDIKEHEIVAEYMSKIPPDRYGEFLAEVGKNYNKALIIFEKNTFGHSVGIRLRDINYDNVYYDEKIVEEMVYADPEEKDDLKAHSGFTIKPNNREKAINKLEEAVRNKKIRIYSSRFLQQMESFIWTGKKAQAIKHKNDDLIMALAIGLQIYDPTGEHAESTSSDGMAWQMAFLASLKKTGVSRGTMETGINTFGSRSPNNPFLPMPTRNQNSVLSPVQTFNNQQTTNKFLGKNLAPGVDPERVAQDYMIRTEFGWLLDKDEKDR